MSIHNSIARILTPQESTDNVNFVFLTDRKRGKSHYIAFFKFQAKVTQIPH